MSGSPADVSPALGSLIREYREWTGYSRGALAARVGLSADELEHWEIVGVPMPPSERFRALADFLDFAEATVKVALEEGAGRGPTRYLPRNPIEVYEAAPVLEDAIAVHGWTPDELAEALGTSPTMVQAWRLGAIEMTDAERLTLSGIVRLRNEPARE